MKEYIERAVALEALSKSGVTCNMRAHKIVASIQAADVVEVRHGRWAPEIHHTYLPVEYDDAGGPILHEYISYRCSLCGREEAKEELYCHCGARMDKEDGHETS